MGHFLDSGNGDTEETGLTIANTDIKLWKSGGTTLVNKNSGGATHMANGVYYCTLDATDTSTYGPLVIFVHVSGALAVKVECTVMEANAYDALYAALGTGSVESNLVQMGASVQSATDLKDFADAGYDPATNKVQGVVLTDTLTTYTGNTPQTGDAYAVVNHVSYGNAQLVRSTTPANPLDVNATGGAGIDLANVDGQASVLSLTNTTVGTVTSNTDMRGTDNAALASVLGALADAAAVGDPTAVDTVMQYVKQLINILVGTTGVVVFPASAAPGNNVSLAEAIRAIYDDTVVIGTPSGADIAADIAAVQSDTDNIQTRLPAALVGGAMDSDVSAIQAGAITAAAVATDAIDADALAADAVDEIRDGLLPTQNAAFNNIEFLFVAASDHVTPVTGASGTAVTRSIDGGAFGAATGTLAEVGNGIYQFDASAADMNGGIITFRFTATGGTPGAPDDRFLTIVTGGGV